MHKSALESFILFNETYLSSLDRLHIVEIGSQDLNSSIKKFINKNHKYTGVDISPGENVDVVLNDPYKFPIEDFHRHVNDNWRFYPDSSLALEKWGLKNGYDNCFLEHFTIEHSGRDIWNDYIAVIIKDKNLIKNYPGRIIHKIHNFRNGRINNNEKILNFNKISQDQDNWG